MRSSQSVTLVLAIALIFGATVSNGQGPRPRTPDRFAVSAAEDAFVLVEQTTGRTWLLGAFSRRTWWTSLVTDQTNRRP